MGMPPASPKPNGNGGNVDSFPGPLVNDPGEKADPEVSVAVSEVTEDVVSTR